MKNITESNRLIAEFMGFTLTDKVNLPEEFRGDNSPYSILEFIDKVREGQEQKPNSINNLHFHSSWDWLMPVLSKIIALPNPKPLETTKGTKQREIQAHAGYANIKEVYKCTVEFIKWYNLQSK